MTIDLATMEAYDFTFRAVDDEGAYCRYDAVLAYTVIGREAAELGVEPGTCYLVYMDAQPGDDGDVATYASILPDPASAEKAQAAVDSGCTPKKPPLLELVAFDSPAEWALIDEVLAAVEELGEED